MGYSIYWTPKKLTEEQVPDQFWKDCEKVLDKIISKGIPILLFSYNRAKRRCCYNLNRRRQNVMEASEAC